MPIDISRKVLFGKLGPLARSSIENAWSYCNVRGHAHIELTHWIHLILQGGDSDLHKIIQAFKLDEARLAQDIQRDLDRLPRAASEVVDLSQHVMDAVERGWVYATLLFEQERVRTGHLVVGLLKTQSLARMLFGISGQFERIDVNKLTADFHNIVAGSTEDRPHEPGTASAEAADTKAGEGDSGAKDKSALSRFTVDWTERARRGEIDTVVGRDEEIRQLVDILMRRRQNNPILTGEAGVGKTAVAEGFAARIAQGDVPPPLQNVRLLALDIGLLQAGAGVRGEFENRIRQLLEEVRASAKPIILFIDEAHTLIGAGGQAGTGDAANMLKPALARGTLRTIAATTWGEYKEYIEKDPALTRRFQVVQVKEPSEAAAVGMMRGIASTLEKHHRVQLLDEALASAVRLSHRYIAGRQLPDKAVSLLDTACARVAISQNAIPADVEDCQRRIQALQVELEIIGREQDIGIDVSVRRAEAEQKLSGEKAQLAKLESRWAEEKALVDSILKLRAELRSGGAPLDADHSTVEPAAEVTKPALGEPERKRKLAELQELQGKLEALQGERPLIMPSVDAQTIAAVIANWTGIPTGRMVKNEIDAVLHLADTLNRRVIGQRHGLDMIARRLQTSRAKLDNPSKPIGVFMLCGPSGVGKTETALALAEALYGGDQNVITINMSEYQEAHTVSLLKGAPPGYKGYGKGGILTEAVRRRPYSVILLDEVEKAHTDVHELFFQVFDKGWLTDSEGRDVDFKNAIILLTTNVGSDLIHSLCKDPDLRPEPDALATALRPPLMKVFPAALLGRLVAIPYYPLSDEMMGDIVRLQLERIKKRVADHHRAPFVYDDDVVKLIVSRCNEVESGGRMIDAILTNTVLPRISVEYLERASAGNALAGVELGVSDGDFTYAFK